MAEAETKGEPRFVTIPEPIVVLDPVTKKPIPHANVSPDGKTFERVPDAPYDLYRVLVTHVFERPEWLVPRARRRMADRILDTVEGIKVGIIVEWTHEWWTEVKKSIDADDFELPGIYGRQLDGLLDCIDNASDKRPEPEAVVDEAAAS